MNYKIKIKNPEESRKIQKICFAKGISWNSGEKKVRHLTKPFLYIQKNELFYGFLPGIFRDDSSPEITGEEFIRCYSDVELTDVELIRPNPLLKKFMGGLPVDSLPEGWQPTTFTTYYGGDLKSIINKKKGGGIMKRLTTLAKKHLNKDIKAFVKLGWLSDDLTVQSDGIKALAEYLFELHRKELGLIAKDEIKEREAEENDSL